MLTDPSALSGRRVTPYLLVLVLAVELAVWECFFVGARPFGYGFPVSAVAAVVGNLLLGTAGARIVGRQGGAVPPGICWLVVALVFSMSGPMGDAVVPGTNRGLAFLLAGVAAAAAATGGGWRRPGRNRAPGATPEGNTGR